jgi:acyl-CoA reductase-like NAD-dependent aldehyde dehydrogenase
LVESAGEIAARAADPAHSKTEVMVSELLPLVEAFRFLEKKAGRILAPRSAGPWTGPLWMGRVSSRVLRDPLGVVGVISPSNYPLYLGGVQVVQAVVAGNAVLWKPAPGFGRVAADLVAHMEAAGFPENLVQVLGDGEEWGRALSTASLDKLVFTGSRGTGIQVLHALADRAVPSVMELSGCDAVFVRADADLDRVVQSLRFGLFFNRSRTCIAPRRVYVHRSLESQLTASLALAFEQYDSHFVPQQDAPLLRSLFETAVRSGARFISGGLFPDGQRVLLPAVLVAEPAVAAQFHRDLFHPVLTMVLVSDDEEAVRLDAECPYALGASIFSRDEKSATALAVRLRAGSIVINDLIAPTADPRVPFGGGGASGFGTTRGPEGLLEMTRPKVLQVRRDTSPVHLSEQLPPVELMLALTRVLHGTRWSHRLHALGGLIKILLKKTFRNATPDRAGRSGALFIDAQPM